MLSFFLLNANKWTGSFADNKTSRLGFFDPLYPFAQGSAGYTSTSCLYTSLVNVSAERDIGSVYEAPTGRRIFIRFSRMRGERKRERDARQHSHARRFVEVLRRDVNPVKTTVPQYCTWVCWVRVEHGLGKYFHLEFHCVFRITRNTCIVDDVSIVANEFLRDINQIRIYSWSQAKIRF